MTKIIYKPTVDHLEIDQRVTEPIYPDDDAQPTEREAEGFRRLVQWLYCEHTHNIEGLAARLIAAAYVFDQGLIGHTSINRIEIQTKGRVSRFRVCQLAKEFSARFGIPLPPPLPPRG